MEGQVFHPSFSIKSRLQELEICHRTLLSSLLLQSRLTVLTTLFLSLHCHDFAPEATPNDRGRQRLRCELSGRVA